MTPFHTPYPAARFRRLRRSQALRDLVAEERLSVKDLIWPVFVTDVPGADAPVQPFPPQPRKQAAP